jgi:thiamine-monophosphate kinase
MGEFDLIARHFTRKPKRALLGVGDDCALLQPRPGTQLAISSDMLVSGRHFFDDVDPASLGHKALAVNLSDLAACGARPLAFTLALALPAIDDAWLSAFAQGLLALADAHGCELIGGDTTRGPLNICITIFGETDGRALLRSGAQAGDDVYISGHLGDAHLALLALQGQLHLPADLLAQTRRRLERPEPRVALGLGLRGVASAAIDVSDGLIGDLGHVLEDSGVGATVHADCLMTLLQARTHRLWPQCSAGAGALNSILSGGDDYELAFTAPQSARGQVLHAARGSNTPVTCIGRVEAETGLRVIDENGQILSHKLRAFDHFDTP